MACIMQPKRTGHSGDKAVTLLATAMVLLGGAACCAFVIVSSTRDLRAGLWVAVGSLAGIVVLYLLFRDRPQGRSAAHSAWFWFRRGFRGEDALNYEVRKRRHRKGDEDLPAPPTVESVRNIADGLNTWVPSSGPRGEHAAPNSPPHRDDAR